MAKGDSSLVYVEEDSVRKLQAVDRALRTLSTEHRKTIVREMNKAIKASTKKTENDIKSAAENLQFKPSGSSGLGTGKSRAERSAKYTKTGKYKLGRGLRQEMAFGVRTQMDRSKYSAGIRIRMASKLPDVNRLAKLSNNRGYIRHPLFGNKKYWYETQVTGGKDWFTKAAAPSLPGVRREVASTLDKYVMYLRAQIDKAH